MNINNSYYGIFISKKNIYKDKDTYKDKSQTLINYLIESNAKSYERKTSPFDYKSDIIKNIEDKYIGVIVVIPLRYTIQDKIEINSEKFIKDIIGHAYIISDVVRSIICIYDFYINADIINKSIPDNTSPLTTDVFNTLKKDNIVLNVSDISTPPKTPEKLDNIDREFNLVTFKSPLKEDTSNDVSPVKQDTSFEYPSSPKRKDMSVSEANTSTNKSGMNSDTSYTIHSKYNSWGNIILEAILNVFVIFPYKSYLWFGIDINCVIFNNLLNTFVNFGFKPSYVNTLDPLNYTHSFPFIGLVRENEILHLHSVNKEKEYNLALYLLSQYNKKEKKYCKFDFTIEKNSISSLLRMPFNTNSYNEDSTITQKEFSGRFIITDISCYNKLQINDTYNFKFKNEIYTGNIVKINTDNTVDFANETIIFGKIFNIPLKDIFINQTSCFLNCENFLWKIAIDFEKVTVTGSTFDDNIIPYFLSILQSNRLLSLESIVTNFNKYKTEKGTYKITKLKEDLSKINTENEKIYTEIMNTLESNKISSMKFLMEGKEESVPSIDGFINFHTHPYELYKKLKCKIGFPSGADYVSFFYGYFTHNTIGHLVVTVEGIYCISFNPDFLTLNLQHIFDEKSKTIKEEPLTSLENSIKKIGINRESSGLEILKYLFAKTDLDVYNRFRDYFEFYKDDPLFEDKPENYIEYVNKLVYSQQTHNEKKTKEKQKPYEHAQEELFLFEILPPVLKIQFKSWENTMDEDRILFSIDYPLSNNQCYPDGFNKKIVKKLYNF